MSVHRLVTVVSRRVPFVMNLGLRNVRLNNLNGLLVVNNRLMCRVPWLTLAMSVVLIVILRVRVLSRVRRWLTLS